MIEIEESMKFLKTPQLKSIITYILFSYNKCIDMWTTLNMMIQQAKNRWQLIWISFTFSGLK